jgi:hypothetical protein
VKGSHTSLTGEHGVPVNHQYGFCSYIIPVPVLREPCLKLDVRARACVCILQTLELGQLSQYSD